MNKPWHSPSFTSFSLKAMPLPGFYKHGSARMERGTILLCLFSIFIFVQDVPPLSIPSQSQSLCSSVIPGGPSLSPLSIPSQSQSLSSSVIPGAPTSSIWIPRASSTSESRLVKSIRSSETSTVPRPSWLLRAVFWGKYNIIFYINK